jgi:hypothetical protein
MKIINDAETGTVAERKAAGLEDVVNAVNEGNAFTTKHGTSAVNVASQVMGGGTALIGIVVIVLILKGGNFMDFIPPNMKIPATVVVGLVVALVAFKIFMG